MSTPTSEYQFDFLSLRDISPRTVRDINFLIYQLTDNRKAEMDERRLAFALRSNQRIMAVWHGASIIGMGRVCVVPPLFCVECEIHDVVVDSAHRGKGIAREIMTRLLREATEYCHADQVNLTSRPDRVAANALYMSLGFQLRGTNYYRYTA